MNGVKGEGNKIEVNKREAPDLSHRKPSPPSWDPVSTAKH